MANPATLSLLLYLTNTLLFFPILHGVCLIQEEAESHCMSSQEGRFGQFLNGLERKHNAVL